MIKAAPALLLSSLVVVACQSAGCAQILFDTAMAAGSVVRAAQYTAEDALVAEERPEAIADRMVAGVRSRGELMGVNRDRDALALGKIYFEGDTWGYSLEDRKAALDALIDSAERINVYLQTPGESDTLTEPARDLVRITLAAIDRGEGAEFIVYSRGRLAIIPPGPVRDALQSETADEMAFPRGLFQFRIVSTTDSGFAPAYRDQSDG